MRRSLLAVAYFVAAAIALAFLVLPIVAIFVHVPPGRLLDQLSNPVVDRRAGRQPQDDR